MTRRAFDPAEIAPHLPRDARRFLTNFDTSPEYESDVINWCRCHPNWVGAESDLTEDGLALRRFLLANPAMIEDAS